MLNLGKPRGLCEVLQYPAQKKQAGLHAYPLMAKGYGLYTVCNNPSAVGLPSFSSWSNNVKSRFRWKKHIFDG